MCVYARTCYGYHTWWIHAWASYTHSHTHTPTQMRARALSLALSLSLSLSFLPSHAQTHMHLHTFSWVHACMRPCAWCVCPGTNVSVWIAHTRMYTHVVVCIYTHGHTHTHTCTYKLLCIIEREMRMSNAHEREIRMLTETPRGAMRLQMCTHARCTHGRGYTNICRYWCIYHPWMIHLILHTHVPECLCV